MSEMALELEATFSAVFEYSDMLGWQLPEKLVFEILSLERQVEGSNIPMPKALIKTLLNIVMPSVRANNNNAGLARVE